MPVTSRPTQWKAAARALLAGALLFAVATTSARTPASPPRIVGYATGWNPAQDAQLPKIDTLIFAFARLHDGRVELDPDAVTRLHSLIALKANHPHLQVLISVGGWGAGGFSEAAATAAGRQAFAQSAAQLIVAQGADGLDVDWEYPGHAESGIGASAADRGNFTLLLRAVRARLDQAAAGSGRHYALSIAAADGPFASGIDIRAVAPLLDWFNLMTYDFVNRMTPTTGHHTGLYRSALAPADARGGDRAVRQFIAAGAPPGKLLLGAAFYGREFADVRPRHHGLYQPYGHYQGEHPWPELERRYIGHDGFVRYRDSAAQAPWLWNATTHRFISYDDPVSLAAKAAYVRSHRLGGIMYWEQSQDPTGELLQAIWRGLHPARVTAP